MDPLTELRNRPSYEDAVATYTTMDQQIQDAVTTAVPGVQWYVSDPAGTAGCSSPYDNLGGRSTGLDTHAVNGGIPDQYWPAALAAATEVAARYGLTDVAVVVDQPGRHEVRFLNPADGAYSKLGTDINASLLTTTQCNLPASKLG